MIGVLIIVLAAAVWLMLRKKGRKKQAEEAVTSEPAVWKRPEEKPAGKKPEEKPKEKKPQISMPVYEAVKIYSFHTPSQSWECPLCGAGNRNSDSYCRVCFEKKNRAAS